MSNNLMKILPKAYPDSSVVKNLNRFRSSPVHYMQDCAAKYGSIVDLHLPMGDFVLVTDPDYIHHILVANHENYKKSRGYKEIARVLGNGLLTIEGEEWKHQRKILQPSFHKIELRKLLPIIWQTGMDSLDQWKDRSTLAVDSEMSNLTLSVLLNSLIRHQNEDLKDAMARNVVFGQEFSTGRIRSPIKLPVWIPIPKHLRFHKMKKEADEIVRNIIAQRNQLDDEKIEDLLSVLLKHFDDKKQFEIIRDELLTFLVAGHETSSLGLSWTLWLLAEHPDIQHKLYEEVKNIQSVEDMDMMEMSNLSLTLNVIKESMRLYPPIWNIVRECKAEDVIGGYPIKRGKQLMMNIYLIHRNKDYWPNPETFDPDRFSKGNEKSWHKHQYMPFGGGPRFCIGNNFALFEMIILLTQMVRNFRFTKANNEDVGFNPLLTLRPGKSMKLNVQRR